MPAITFSGIASGIDGDAIIKSLMDARKLATQPLRNTVEFNKKENTALEEFTTKMLALSDTLKDFRSLSGNGLSKIGSSSNSDAVGVSATNSAIATSTSITVQNLAQSATFSFADRFNDLTTPIAPGLTGTAAIDVVIGQGPTAQTVSVNIDNTTNLTQLMGDLNTAGAGKFAASAVNVGTESAPQYAVVLQSMETGIEKGSLAVTVDPAITGQGLFGTSTVSQAEDAVLTLTGIGQVTRSSNRIAGLIPGVTLDLKQENTGPIQVTVGDDREKTATKLEAVIASLNELVKYQSDNDQIVPTDQDGTVTNEYKDLAKVRVDNSAISALRDAISNTNASGLGTTVNVFADLGVTIERDGSYKFDRDKFLQSVGDDPIGSQEVLTSFADKVATTNGIIDEYTKFQGQIDIAISANEDENKRINDRVERIDQQLEEQATAMRMMFARLEQKIGDLNSQGSALASMISGGFGTGSK